MRESVCVCGVVCGVGDLVDVTRSDPSRTESTGYGLRGHIRCLGETDQRSRDGTCINLVGGYSPHFEFKVVLLCHLRVIYEGGRRVTCTLLRQQKPSETTRDRITPDPQRVEWSTRPETTPGTRTTLVGPRKSLGIRGGETPVFLITQFFSKSWHEPYRSYNHHNILILITVSVLRLFVPNDTGVEG